jgi:hypothetical protein
MITNRLVLIEKKNYLVLEQENESRQGWLQYNYNGTKSLGVQLVAFYTDSIVLNLIMRWAF